MKLFVTRKGKITAGVTAFAICLCLVAGIAIGAFHTGKQTANNLVQLDADTQVPLASGKNNGDITTENDIVGDNTIEDDAIVNVVENKGKNNKPAKIKNKNQANTPAGTIGATGNHGEEVATAHRDSNNGNGNSGNGNSGSTNPSVPKKDLKLDGYTLKWEDNFDGTELDRSAWNVELHQAGWVNSELQEYVDSTDNLSVANGYLTITPQKMEDENGNVTYTSGRINTQGKKDFTYGLFEARVKVPDGQGYLPAFWLMSSDENIYGQWPRCGEIDCMEVMGQDTTKAYGTIHYGEPHQESQGTYVVSQSNNYADSFHTFSCEWEPGSIKWYVDGILYHEENDWYSTTVGQGTLTYPAPFDQPFYVILNLAVGGSWVGNPDASTSFENQAYVVDYVKVYQKDSYDENVTRPIKDVTLRQPNADGNYINNGNFAVAENLSDDVDWKFLTALEGNATPSIANNTMTITTENAGTVDYSVQLVQANLPFEKGATYQVQFDAFSSDARTMKVAVKAPDHGYSEYMPAKTVALGTESQTYTYEFKMTSDSDANGRLEFNMGAANSTATINIQNVSVKKVKEADPNEIEQKTILANGSYVYNGSFQEGTNHMGYWDVTNTVDANVSVTGFADGRRLKIVAPVGTALTDVVISQSDLAFKSGNAYYVSFSADTTEAHDIEVTVGGYVQTVSLTAGKNTYSFVIPASATLTDGNLSLAIGHEGTTLLDDISITENAMIKNGSFDAGTSGYEIFVDGSASASYVVDSLSEQNALDFTIDNTADQDWKIQLKQNNITLEQGHWYKLTFDAKSTMNRKIRAIMQGDEAHSWAAYSGENIVDLTGDFQTFTKEFQMNDATDTGAFLSICLGKLDQVITTQHRVVIDNISLEEIDAPAVDPSDDLEEVVPPQDPVVIPAGTAALLNTDFSNGMDSWSETIANWDDYPTDVTRSISGNAITYDITNAGTEDWNIQLKQTMPLEEGAEYFIYFKATSSATRMFKCGVLSADYSTWYGGINDSDAKLYKNVTREYATRFTPSKNDDTAYFYISLGNLGDTPASTVTISDIQILKVTGDAPTAEEPTDEHNPMNVNLLANADFANGFENWSEEIGGGAVATRSINDGAVFYDIENAGANDWDIKLVHSVKLIKGETYRVSFTINSSASRFYKTGVMGTSYAWYGGVGDELAKLVAGEDTEVSYEFSMNADDAATYTYISLGNNANDVDGTPASIVKISNLRIERIQ